MNQTTTYFIQALWNQYLKPGKITQAKIADGTGIDRSQINDFLHGRKNFSENRMSKIADFLKTTYIDMLVAGREITGDGKTTIPGPALCPACQKAAVIDMAPGNILNRFKDKKTALGICAKLVEIESVNPATLTKIAAYIDGIAEGLKITCPAAAINDNNEKTSSAG